jgi:hypothetical protein
VISYTIGKSFELLDGGDRCLEEKVTADTNEKASNAINPSTYGTSFRGPTMVTKM